MSAILTDEISLRLPFQVRKTLGVFLDSDSSWRQNSAHENNQDYFGGNASTGGYVVFLSIRAAATHAGSSPTFARGPGIARESYS
jgi:hypothetical protein